MVYGLIASSCELSSTNVLLYLAEDEMISMNLLLEYCTADASTKQSLNTFQLNYIDYIIFHRKNTG